MDFPWLPFGALIVAIIAVGLACAWCNRRWPEQFDETTWPCERFRDRTIEHIPARCLKHFGAGKDAR